MPQHETLCYALGRMRFYIPGRKQPLEASKSFIWILAGCCCFEMIGPKRFFAFSTGNTLNDTIRDTNRRLLL